MLGSSVVGMCARLTVAAWPYSSRRAGSTGFRNAGSIVVGASSISGHCGSSAAAGARRSSVVEGTLLVYNI